MQNAHNNNVFSVVYRVVTIPVARRYFGFMGIGSHSDTWYTKEVKTTVDLGTAMTIGQWAPKNTDSALSGSIGIGFGSDDVSISASVNLNISQLHFVNRTNVATGHYERGITRYPAKPITTYIPPNTKDVSLSSGRIPPFP